MVAFFIMFGWLNKKQHFRRSAVFLERVTRLELATSTLARLRSTR